MDKKTFLKIERCFPELPAVKTGFANLPEDKRPFYRICVESGDDEEQLRKFLDDNGSVENVK